MLEVIVEASNSGSLSPELPYCTLKLSRVRLGLHTQVFKDTLHSEGGALTVATASRSMSLALSSYLSLSHPVSDSVSQCVSRSVL